MVAAYATDATSVMVEFAEPMDLTSSETTGNYVLDKVATVTGAVLQADQKSVLLTTAALAEGVTYTLTVNNVKDTSNNTIALVDSQRTVMWEDVPPPLQLQFQDGVHPDAT